MTHSSIETINDPRKKKGQSTIQNLITNQNPIATPDLFNTPTSNNQRVTPITLLAQKKKTIYRAIDAAHADITKPQVFLVTVSRQLQMSLRRVGIYSPETGWYQPQLTPRKRVQSLQGVLI